MPVFDGLPKREREILSIVFRLGEATARNVQAALADGTSYSAVRTFLATLEAKGVLAHRLDGLKYLWSPATDPETEGASLIVEATQTFFNGSKERAIAALIERDELPLSQKDYVRLKVLIEHARRKGR